MRFAVRNCKSRVADVAVAASRWEKYSNGESPEEGGREWMRETGQEELE